MKTRRKIEVFATSAEMIEKAAELIVGILSDTLRKKGRASLVLSGGSTPKALYELLASEKYRDKISWENILIFFGDERCVPPDDPQSNYKMSHEALLSKVPVPEENIFRMKGELPPEAAAAQYEAAIKNSLGDGNHFDVVLLGIGTDGHTASLFPGTGALNETEKLVAANYVEKLNAFRITLTFRVINTSQNIIFLAVGKEKAEAIGKIFEEKDEPLLPAQMVDPADGTIFWMLEKTAAAAMTR